MPKFEEKVLETLGEINDKMTHLLTRMDALTTSIKELSSLSICSGNTELPLAETVKDTTDPYKTEASASNGSFTFKPTPDEEETGLLHVQYNCSKDRYDRQSTGGTPIQGWQSCVHHISSSVFRMVEYDWRVVYLARTREVDKASLTWKFDFTDSLLSIERCNIRAESAVFESGLVTWTIRGDDQCFNLNGPELMSGRDFSLEGCRTLTITVHLGGGNPTEAWQHAQLFRQGLTSDNYPFEVKIHLV